MVAFVTFWGGGFWVVYLCECVRLVFCFDVFLMWFWLVWALLVVFLFCFFGVYLVTFFCFVFWRVGESCFGRVVGWGEC